MTSTEVLSDKKVYGELDDLVEQFCTTDDIIEKRRIDWAARVKAAESTELDPELKYLLATFGLEEGLSPNATTLIDKLKTIQNELVMLPLGQHTYEYGGLFRIMCKLLIVNLVYYGHICKQAGASPLAANWD